MPLSAGFKFGQYDIVSLLGAGGMGEVYRARDSRLQREVAIKILPEGFDDHPERVTRFTREAQLLASLNHPAIASIYGLEDGPAEAGHHVRGLVMELVEGPTLADRLVAGPMPIDEVLSVAKQIVDGLEAAHEQGIIHRDLKPANVKVRSDGAVKILDFGLAKALEPGAAAAAGSRGSPVALTHSPTLA